MKASVEWYSATGAQYRAGGGFSGCAQLAHYTAEYREWGDGPPLVIIPGLAGGLELLGPLVRLLARRFRVISYQLRGEDNCFVLRRPFGMDDLVSDLGEFIDYMRLERPALLGVSFGGVLALEFAARHSRRLDRLVVQGTGSRFEPGLIHQVAGTVLSRFPLPSDNPFVNQFFNLLFGGKPRDRGLFEFVTRQCWQTDQSVMAHRLHLVESFNLEGRLSDIRTPTLILSGERDVLVSNRGLAELRDEIPDSRLVRLPRCGHLAFVTRPNLVAQELTNFVSPVAVA